MEAVEWDMGVLARIMMGRASRDKRRNRIDIMFGRRKDWRRIATRYDRGRKVLLSAIALAATLLLCL